MAKPLTYEKLHEALKWMAREKSEWAGVPMPLPDFTLELESKYPYQLGQLGRQPEKEDGTVVNQWWNERFQCYVGIERQPDGSVRAFIAPYRSTDILVSTLGTIVAWPMEAEYKAQEKLATLVTEHQMKAYLMTGTFLESSPRSNIAYLFRRLRPTLAFSKNGTSCRLLAGLCAHSIGYYGGTWAGVMVPTDEIISHLVFMRGDEHGFWKMCNQHPPGRPQCGI